MDPVLWWIIGIIGAIAAMMIALYLFGGYDVLRKRRQ